MSKVLFVTGSSRGRRIVQQAVAAGHRVATARDPPALDDLVARFGEHVHVEPLDVTDLEAAPDPIRGGATNSSRIADRSRGEPRRYRPFISLVTILRPAVSSPIHVANEAGIFR